MRLSGIDVLTMEWNKNENKVSSYILLIRSKKIMINMDTKMTLYKTTVMAMTKTKMIMTKNETCSMEKYTSMYKNQNDNDKNRNGNDKNRLCSKEKYT